MGVHMENDAGYVEELEGEPQSSPAPKDVILVLALVLGFVGVSAWAMGYGLPLLYILLAITALQLVTNRLSVRSLRGRALTITLAAICALLGALLLVPNRYPALREHESAMADLKALAGNPAKLDAALREASDQVLTGLRSEGFEPARTELARRDALGRARGQAADQATERANAPQIAKLERDLAQTPEWAIYDRQKVLRELVRLAPANERFARELVGAESAVYAAERNLETPHKNVSVVSSQWTLGGFGSVYLLDITLRNTGQFSVKDFEVFCRNYAASGTVLESSRGTILQSLKGGQTKRFRDINLGFVNPQVARSACEIVGAKTGGAI